MRITILSHPHSGIKLLRQLIKRNFNQDSFPDKQHIQANKKIKTYKKLLLIRDGRDVMASLYAGEKQRANDFPEWEEAKIWKEMSFSDFLRYPYRKLVAGPFVNPVRFWVEYNRQWEEKGVAGRVQYERIVREQKRILEVLGKFLKKTPKYEYINNQNIIGVPTTWAGYHPAKSNWKKFFNDEDMKYFDNIAGDLMKRYLYYE
jgi:hypothetical protein